MKKIFIIAGVVLLLLALPFASMITESLTAQTNEVPCVREGDVIFQTSPSNQSKMIQIATRSKISHCGIVVMKDGEPYVLEARKTLVLTPLDKFIARGVEGRYWLKRPEKDNIKITYDNYLGTPYDLAFKFGNDKLYCSELVYEIYKNQLGVELCEPKKIADYMLPGIKYLSGIEEEMNKRGITLEQYAVAPVDVFNSMNLKPVK